MYCGDVKGLDNYDLFKSNDKVKLKLGEVTSTQYLRTYPNGKEEIKTRDCRLILEYKKL
ncbi:MAG: hypothetical protein KKA65_03765 [Nanoarchaeota archaeon]|nr:hypothetical protein [Nanoarchaeota archaeon]MBU4241817.1 hypothetical protein [Nanoarchaeota archaeon]MBU4352228.1 hypothetical protein [Nanoarchaeota archaeon]MBU4456594.1 hypothetical protein [Nanoarchaeota archaeon]MCG2719823.1 hypothetical protein [Nanoarchaeota archaeon]